MIPLLQEAPPGKGYAQSEMWHNMLMLWTQVVFRTVMGHNCHFNWMYSSTSSVLMTPAISDIKIAQVSIVVLVLIVDRAYNYQ